MKMSAYRKKLLGRQMITRAAVAAAMVALLGVGGWAYISAVKPPPVAAAMPQKFDPGAARGIRIESAVGRLDLQKIGTNWYLRNKQNYPVSSVMAGNTLYAIAQLKNEGVQAEGAVKLQEAGLASDNPARLHIAIYSESGAVLNEWYLGRHTDDGEILASLPNDDKVYRLQVTQIPPPQLSDWMPDFLLELRGKNFSTIHLGVDNPDNVQLIHTDPATEAWRVKNIPKKRQLRADSGIVKLPRIFRNAAAMDVQKLGALRPDSPARWRSHFVTADGLRLILTQAPAGGKIWTHFFAEAILPSQQAAAQVWNNYYGQWAYAMGKEFDKLIGLTIQDITEPEIETAPVKKSKRVG